MPYPHFTTDKRRIRTLQKNYDLGVEREKIPRAVREEEDIRLLRVSHDEVARLHVRALKARMRLLESKKKRSSAKKRQEEEDEDLSD